jgi:hypothetical protein
MTPLQHLLVVERVRRRLDWPITCRPPMTLGAIAPDAHRIVADIDHRDIHFRSRTTTDRRLIDFLSSYLRPAVNAPPGNLEFWSGWLSHIIADDVWRQNLQRNIPDLWDGVVHGTCDEADRLRKTYLGECDKLDEMVHAGHGEVVAELREALLAAEIRLIIEPLTLQDLHSWRLTVTQSMLPPLAGAHIQLQYLTIEFVEECIFQAVEEVFHILQWEIDEPPLPPIF